MCCSLWGHKESDMTVIEQQQSSHRLDNLGFSCLASWMAPGPTDAVLSKKGSLA